MKIDWKRKLSSRKFWVAVAGFVTQILLATGAAEGTVTQVTAVIMAGATLITYMLAEGIADSANAGASPEEIHEAIGFQIAKEDEDE